MLTLRTLLDRRTLWKFHGGLHVPDEKTLSNGLAIEQAPLPKRLILPLRQHIGAPAVPTVEVGEQVRTGQLIARTEGPVSACVHATSSGVVRAIAAHPVPHPSGLWAPCILIDTDGADTWTDLPEPLSLDTDLDPHLIRERIRWAGIVGLGGASFPTSVKLNPGPDHPIHTLIINGAECEPYITCDDRLMRERAARILSGARIIRRLLGQPRILIGIEDNKPEAIAAMRQALAAAAMDAYAEIRAIPTLYPSGGEKQLIRILTGREVPRQTIPAHLGIVCQNVASAAAVADAVIAGRPLISRVVTITGRAIASPRNLEVRIGTPIAELIAHCGGFREPARKLVCGGPMMGFEILDQASPVTKPANCILALTAIESPDPGPALACIRCGRCAEVCPARLLPQQLYWHARAKDLDHVQDYHLFDCIECGCCAQVCPSHIPLVQYYRFAKNQIWAREEDKRKAERARTRHEARQTRLERLERERKAKLRQKKESLEQTPHAPDGAADAKQAAIAAARERVAAKKAALARNEEVSDAPGSSTG